MGGQLSAQGTPKTPLQCVLDNLTALSDPGCKNRRPKLLKLSQKIWPLCHVGPVSWPKDGSISVPLQELEKYLWLNSREKELPYLYLFYNLASDLEKCEKGGLLPTYMPRVGKLAALKPLVAASRPTSKILFEGRPPLWKTPEEEDSDFPPPYVLVPAMPELPRNPPPFQDGHRHMAPLPQAPIAEQPPLVTSQAGTGGGQRDALREAPIRERSPSPQGRGDPEAAAQAPSPPPSPSPPRSSPPRRSERARKEPCRFSPQDPDTFTQPANQFPLREVPGPNGLVYIHTPFSTGDLYSWKQGLPPYRESPQQYVDLVSRIMCTHLPNIPDLFALLSALLNEEEKRLVLAQAILAFDAWRGEYIRNQPRQDGNDVPAPPTGTELLCLNPPANANNPNTQFGREMIEGARRAVKEGLQKGVPRVVNYQKIYHVIQNPEESPAEFLIRLKDAYRRHTDVDPEEPGNLAAIRTSFITQCAPDIRRKIQKLQNPATQPLDTLIQTAFQVFYQRPEVEEAKSDSKMKKKASLLAAALQPYMAGPPQPAWGSRAPPHDPFCCWLCGDPSHFARECPRRRAGRGRDQPHPNLLSHNPGPRGPPPTRYPGPRGQQQGRGEWSGNQSVPLVQGNRYPCEVQAGPQPSPRNLMAALEEDQD